MKPPGYYTKDEIYMFQIIRLSTLFMKKPVSPENMWWHHRIVELQVSLFRKRKKILAKSFKVSLK